MKKKLPKLKIKEFDLTDSASKRYFNRFLFTEVAPKYHIATKVLSFGRDKIWKKKMIKKLPKKEKAVCLDIACGTGDITFLLAKKYKDGEIIGIDLNEKMIEIANKLLEYKYNNIKFKVADMSDAGFNSEQFDIITGGYALRNAPDLKKVLNEIYRIMKYGANASFLDFSKPNFKLLQIFKLFLLKIWGNIWGIILHKNPDIYGYIAESLKTFPSRKNFNKLLTECGFKNIKRKKLFFGFTEIVYFTK